MRRDDGKEERKEEVKGERKEAGGQREAPTRPGAEMMALTKEAYGGGMYGTDDSGAEKGGKEGRASDTQSVEGLAGGDAAPSEKILSHPPPPSSGDRDIDITGQSYFQ